jgi:hypothetical protein
MQCRWRQHGHAPCYPSNSLTSCYVAALLLPLLLQCYKVTTAQDVRNDLEVNTNWHVSVARNVPSRPHISIY